MATCDSTKGFDFRPDILQLQRANAMMRIVNRALARGDDAVLVTIGFSPEHVGELRRQGGFAERVFNANYRTISYLRRHLGMSAGAASH